MEVFTVRPTFFKSKPIQSTELGGNDKQFVDLGHSFQIKTWEYHSNDHYQVELENPIPPVGKEGFFYYRHVYLGTDKMTDNSHKILRLTLSDEWDSIKHRAVQIRGGQDNTCVAFASETLRRIGFDIPVGYLLTKELRNYLDRNYERDYKTENLTPGDICFSEDHPKFPNEPAHVYFYVLFPREGDHSYAFVVDNQGRQHIRNMKVDGLRTKFAYAYRL